MRVLFINPAAGLGGSERSLLDVLSALTEARAPVEIRLVLLTDGELLGRARAVGIDSEVIALPASLDAIGESGARGLESASRWARALVGVPRYGARLRRALRTFRPHVVHTNGMKAHLLAAAVAPDYSRVVHLRDFPRDRALSRRLLPLCARRAVVVANSRAVADDVRALVPAVDVRVVYNGIDTGEFRPGPRELSTLARLAGLPPPPEDVVVVGLVATYAWWKGHRTFIDAARRVTSVATRPLRFYIVGGPIYRTQGSQIAEGELRSAIAAAGLEGSLGLVPFQSAVAPVYHGLDVLVHASERREPFGRTIVEAMASERAVVVARAGGAAELFREGETAIGFTPGNSADLARAILVLVDDEAKRRTLGHAARLEVIERFDRRRLARELVELYSKLVPREVW